jgi:hypothetical protein
MYIREKLNYSDYVVYEDRKSEIDQGRVLLVEIGMKCPGCKTFLEGIDDETGPIEHGESITCKSCGLKMTMWGNQLICERW